MRKIVGWESGGGGEAGWGAGGARPHTGPEAVLRVAFFKGDFGVICDTVMMDIGSCDGTRPESAFSRTTLAPIL